MAYVESAMYWIAHLVKFKLRNGHGGVGLHGALRENTLFSYVMWR